MNHKVLFILLLFSHSIFSQQNNFEGSYSGTFEHGNFSSDLGLNITQQSDQYMIRFNSLQQNAFGIPARDITLASDTLKFALQSDYFRYEFNCILLDNNKLKLNLSVDGKSFDTTLDKLSGENNLQVRHKDIRFRSENLLLYGTIYYPVKANGKAVYLVTSSGNHDRSASRAEAILLAQNGYITMHTDKRGTGISDGNWQKADIPTLCVDDMSAIKYLSQAEKLSLSEIGIKGSSQGAAKVPYILSKMPELRFGVAVSCPGSTLLESDLNYWKNRNRDAIDPKYFDQATELQKSVFQHIAGDFSREELDVKVHASQNEPWYKHVWVPAPNEVETDLKLNYSPLPYFEQVRQPLLIIQGSMDEIIPPQSLRIIKKNLGSHKNRKNEFVILESANHSMMFLGKSDFPYWQTIHPDYMDVLLNWMGK